MALWHALFIILEVCFWLELGITCHVRPFHVHIPIWCCFEIEPVVACGYWLLNDIELEAWSPFQHKSEIILGNQSINHLHFKSDHSNYENRPLSIARQLQKEMLHLHYLYKRDEEGLGLENSTVLNGLPVLLQQFQRRSRWWWGLRVRSRGDQSSTPTETKDIHQISELKTQKSHIASRSIDLIVMSAIAALYSSTCTVARSVPANDARSQYDDDVIKTSTASKYAHSIREQSIRRYRVYTSAN